MTPAVIEKWRARGVRMATFCAHSEWRDRWQLNFRNHRKNVVVDGRVGFIGGHNVGDEYLGINPKFGRWRDTHVRVEGPSAMQLQMAFIADWFFATGEALAGHWDGGSWSDVEGEPALVLASGPSDQFERCTLFFLNVISMAERRLWIASPYFVPDEGILQALQLAAIRGVEVRILLPMKPDHRLRVARLIRDAHRVDPSEHSHSPLYRWLPASKSAAGGRYIRRRRHGQFRQSFVSAEFRNHARSFRTTVCVRCRRRCLKAILGNPCKWDATTTSPGRFISRPRPRRHACWHRFCESLGFAAGKVCPPTCQ